MAKFSNINIDKRRMARVTKPFVESQQVLLCYSQAARIWGDADMWWEVVRLLVLVRSTGRSVSSWGVEDCLPVESNDTTCFGLIADLSHPNVVVLPTCRLKRDTTAMSISARSSPTMS